MKKILIIIPGFSMGGTILSLSSFLSIIDVNDIKVDIFCRDHNGGYSDNLTNCSILKENIWLSSRIRKGNVLQKLTSWILFIIRNMFKLIKVDLYPLYCKVGGRQIDSISYDAVCSYEEMLTRILCFIPAKKRIAWVRCEYERYQKINNIYDEAYHYSKIDKVVCVSEFCKDSLLRALPVLKDKVVVINNVMNVDDISKKASQDISSDKDFNTECFTILSAGRIDPVKQFEFIPAIANDIRHRCSIPFKWFIVGSSSSSQLLDKIKSEIKKYNLEQVVCLIGERRNLFPYMAKADLFVHTSKSETFSRVVNEAKCLEVPVVINNYGCSGEFVQSGVDGLIVPVEQMGSVLSDLIVNREKLVQIREYLHNNKYDNKGIYAKTINLI